MHYCYIWYDPKTGIPRYVGKGSGDRVWKHIKYPSGTRCSNMLLKRIREGFSCIPEIFECQDEESAFNLEIELIKKFGRIDLKTGTLFNLTAGGDGLRDLSETTRRKMGEASGRARTGKKHSEERNRKKSESMKGKPNLSGIKLQKQCTVDGITIYPSVRDLVTALGHGKSGIKSPNFRFVEA